jgi:hypothetical protein
MLSLACDATPGSVELVINLLLNHAVAQDLHAKTWWQTRSADS